ncbi:hypothetical protein DID88_002305 [Monilinia fructigena]|uniref:Uncharacterized protein n=1 Tax=Monilinia fructigena TaxID=38457 RepID=A0A395ICZ4_9HELO|nr:hypothetical protein DID88_002305 [Monilinia fructigena]
MTPARFGACGPLEAVLESDIIEPYGNDLAATLRVQLLWKSGTSIFFLMPPGSFTSTKALIVVPLAILKDDKTKRRKDLWTYQNIQLGGQEKGDRVLKAAEVSNYLSSINDETTFDEDEMVIEDDSEEPSIGNMSESANLFGQWLGQRLEALIKALETNNRSATRVLVKNDVVVDPALVDFSQNLKNEELAQFQQNCNNEKQAQVQQNRKDEKQAQVQQNRKDEKLARSLTLLGDVYAENKFFEELSELMPSF